MRRRIWSLLLAATLPWLQNGFARTDKPKNPKEDVEAIGEMALKVLPTGAAFNHPITKSPNPQITQCTGLLYSKGAVVV